MSESPILVTGATGFIGGRLVRRLVSAGLPWCGDPMRSSRRALS
jgi:uncharacterized protein YbjT (DUF2867 family)